MQAIHIDIEGLNDVTDAGHIEKALEAVPGVKFVEIQPGAAAARLVHEGADRRRLTAALANLGYTSHITAEPPPSTDT